MKGRQVSFGLLLLGSLIVGAQLAGGVPGLVGMAIGLGMGAFGVFVLYQTVRMLREATRQSTAGILLVLLMFFFKFPAIGLGAYVSYQQGIGGLIFFVVGVLVVYFALIWRALRSDLYPR